MKKILYSILFFIAMLVIVFILNTSFADSFHYSSEVLLDPEYTTAYENDVFNLNIGLNEKPKESYDYPAYITFDKNVFELDVSNIKSANAAVEYKKYEVEETKDKITYIFYYELDEKILKSDKTNYNKLDSLYDSEKVNGENWYSECDSNWYNNSIPDYDNRGCDIVDGSGVADFVLFSGVKIKVKTDVNEGVYLVESGNYDMDVHYMPISVINSEESSKTFKLINSIYEKEEYINNVTCNSRCRIVGIGDDYYNAYSSPEESSEPHYIFVDFFDGKKEIINIDENSLNIDFDIDYTSVYRNDEINMTISSYGNISNLIKTNIKTNYLEKNNDYYVGESIYVIYDNSAFDIDLSNIKTNDDNFIYRNHEIIKNSNISLCKIDFYVKESKIDLYLKDEKNILFSNIKFKTKENAKLEKYLFDVDIYYDDMEIEFDSEYIGFYKIVSIIDNKNPSKTLKSGVGYLGDGWDVYDKHIDIDVSEDKSEYTYVYYEDDLYVEKIYIECNQKCLAKRYEQDYDNQEEYIDGYVIDVKYDDGSEKRYIFKNSISNSYKFSPLFDEWYNVIIIGNGNRYVYQEYFDKIENYLLENKDQIGYWYSYFSYTYYDYSSLTDDEKTLFRKFNIKFDEIEYPYIYLSLGEDNFDYLIGEVSDEELYQMIDGVLNIVHVEIPEEGIIEDSTNNSDIDIKEENEIISDVDTYFETEDYNDKVRVLIFCAVLIIVFDAIFMVLLFRHKKLSKKYILMKSEIEKNNVKVGESGENETK